MTDLYVRRSHEVCDRDDDGNFVCFIHRPDRSGDTWTAYHLGKHFHAPTRGLLLSEIERYMISKEGRLARKAIELAYKENHERHLRERGVKKVKGAK